MKIKYQPRSEAFQTSKNKYKTNAMKGLIETMLTFVSSELTLKHNTNRNK